MYNQEKFTYIKKRLVEIFRRDHPPEIDPFLEVINKANSTLTSEDMEMRPYDSYGLPGGMVLLKRNIPTIIVSDIHARLEYFLNILLHEDILGNSILEKLFLDQVQIVCVGDGVHAESRAAKRWVLAFEEYKDGYKNHDNIDEEMRESFGVMEMVMEVKNIFPMNFHFLKGNHENITNEKGSGNFPYMKYAQEGPMIDYYVKKFYGNQISEQYAFFEKNLPILAVGMNFLISHAEPGKFYNREEIIEYRNNPEVILGLTWTDDGASEEGSVESMLNAYVDDEHRQDSYYFGGHRPVEGLYNPRSQGRYIQIHNPNKNILCVIKPDRKIMLDRDITEIKKKLK